MKFVFISILTVFASNFYCYSFEVNPEVNMPAVVDIIVEDKNEDTQETSSANGSGFFVDETGYIVTNNHVIESSENIKVVTDDGSEYKAKIVGTDRRLDIALLKIDLDSSTKVKVLTFADSDKVNLLDDVFIIGNPLGIGKSTIKGSISCKNRDLSKLTSEMDLDGDSILFFQINADVCQGYSGGPVCDKNGNVIGIMTVFMWENARVVGMSFAIPANLVQKTINQLKEHGRMQRSWLGFSIKKLDHESSKILLNANSGCYIDSVASQSPAKSAGIRSGDILISVNDIKITDTSNIGYLLDNLPVGKIIPIQVLQNGKVRKFSITVATAPEDSGLFITDADSNEQDVPNEKINGLGFGVTNLLRSMREVFSIPSHEHGVLVSSVDRSIVLNIYPGCVIKTVNQHPVQDVESFKKLIENNKKIVLYVYDPYNKISFYTSISYDGDKPKLSSMKPILQHDNISSIAKKYKKD